MAILNIVKEDDDTLRKVCRPVTEITPRIIRLLDDMKETLEDANGAGLAAPQVGILRRICVVDTGEEVIELMNPKNNLRKRRAESGWKAVFQFPTYGDTLTVRLRS